MGKGRLIARAAVGVLVSALGLALPAGGHAAGTGPSERLEVAPGVFMQPVGGGSSPQPRTRAARSGPSPEEGIIDGNPTTIQQWPWQVAITYHPSTGGSAHDRQYCGGSLLTPTFVVTAAHCLFNEDTDSYDPPGSVAVVSGRTRLSSDEGQEVDVVDVYGFFDSGGNNLYEPASTRWDVAMLELASPSPSPTIKIAGPAEGSLWGPGRTAYVTGWGSTVPTGGGYPDALHVAQVRMVSDNDCRQEQGQSLHPDVMVCAGPPRGDTCDGDSGGPLVVPMAGGGYRLVGDTSFGPDPCGQAAAVYGRLAANPIRASVRNGILALTGIDVVGSGASPPPGPPTPAPSGPTAANAKRKALKYSKRQCRRFRDCRRYSAGNCKARGAGYRCKARNYDRRKGRKFTCVRKVKITQRANGALKVRTIGRWKCRRGWR